MEFWDIYDQNRMKNGAVHPRGAPFPDGVYRLAVHACVFNARAEMLIQQRQPFKADWPDKWDVTMGGNALAGENSQQAAERELAEEIGLQICLKGVRPHLTVNFEHGFDDYYLLEAYPELGALHLQESEVRRVRWARREDIHALINAGAFIPYHHGFIDLLFDMKGRYGCQSRG